MRKIISIMLCFILLLQGCYTTYNVKEEEPDILTIKQSKRIFIYLKDGSIIQSEPYNYIEINEPSDFIFGEGKLINIKTGKSSKFKGKLIPISIDTLKSGGLNNNDDMIKISSIEFWISEYEKVQMKQGSYFEIKKDSGIGLWCNGIKKNKMNETKFTGVIPFQDIEKIELEKFTKFPVSLLIGAVTIIAVVLGFHYGY